MYALCLNRSYSRPFCSNSSPISTIPFLSQLYMLFSSFLKNPLSPFSDSFICTGVRSSSHECILKKKKTDFSSSSNHQFLRKGGTSWTLPSTILIFGRIYLVHAVPATFHFFVCNCTVASSNYCFAADIHFLWSLRSLHLLFCDDHLAWGAKGVI